MLQTKLLDYLGRWDSVRSDSNLLQKSSSRPSVGKLLSSLLETVRINGELRVRRTATFTILKLLPRKV